MTSILLHDYVEQIDKLIDDNRLVEAIEHCRHILHSYPRHIDTYRVMGKALLEKQEYDAANDLFLRILGTDPNDFISHVGLSIIYKEESQFDQALWHLERAYEIQPYNVAIQGELRQLYTTQTDQRPGIIPLTRGALVRLYMQGELYQQAITELRRILAEEPDRMDLQVLLAEALWRDDQRIDAEEVCLHVLELLPNCIVTNAILAEIWLQTGRIPEAQKYLHRLHSLTCETEKSLDRETIVGQAFATEGAFILPKEASLEFLQTGTILPDKSAEPTADWVGEVSFDNLPDDGSGEVVMEPESGMHSYDWLAEIGDSQTNELGETAVSEEVASETDWFSQGQAKESLKLSTDELDADWLADLRGEIEEETDFQPMDMEELADELSGALPAEETDWFGNADEIADDEMAAFGADLGDTAVTEEPQAVDSEGLPNWLDALGNEDSPIEIDATSLMDDSLADWADSEPHIVEESKTPFWLSEIAGDELEAVQLSPEDALDWMAEDEEDEAISEIDDLIDELAEEPGDAELIEDDLSFLDDLELPVLDEPEAVESEFGPTAVLDEAEQAGEDDLKPVSETDALGGADDWLAALTEGGIDETIDLDQPLDSFAGLELDATTSELAALSDADNWLESAEADLDAILQSENIEEIYPNLAIPELDSDDFADIPDWLDSEVDLSEESEAAVSSENDPQEPPKPEEPEMEIVPEEDPTADVLNWLDELTSEKHDIPSLPDPPIETEGMPSWLNTADLEQGVEVVDEWDSASAEIPDWLQEPVSLDDVDQEENLLGEDLPTDVPGLTGLLAQIDVAPDASDAPEEALPLDQMDSLLTDWVDEDADGSLTELLGGMEMADDSLPAVDDWFGDDFAEETPSLDEEEEAELEGSGLTGLLSNLTLTEPEPTRAEDDFMSGLLDELEDEEPDEDAGGFDDSLGLGDLDLENVSLTQLLSSADDEDAGDFVADTAVSDDDWLADLTSLTDDEDLFDEEPEAEESVGLTGMLANLWSDDVAEEKTAESEPQEIPSDYDTATDEMGLTELLAGINYEEDAIASEINLDDFGVEPIEPSLTEILSGIDMDEDDDGPDLPISAEDTTWLTQLEADTGALQEAGNDDFNMAEETGLDWLTLPDEPEEEVLPEMPEPARPKEGEVVVEADSTPEDWDDPMAWLEELAAQQDEPVEELPSVAETMLDEELDSADQLMATAPMAKDTDWLAELTGGDLDDEDELDDWLAETEAEALAAELFDADADEPGLPEAQAMTESEPMFDESELARLEDLEDLFAEANVPAAELPDTQVMAEAGLQSGDSDLDDLENLDDLFADEGEISWLDELATDMLNQPEAEEIEEAPAVVDSLTTHPDMMVLDEDEEDALEEAEGAFDLEDLWDDELADEELFAAELTEPELGSSEPLMAETAVPEDEELSWLDTVMAESDEEEAEEGEAWLAEMFDDARAEAEPDEASELEDMFVAQDEAFAADEDAFDEEPGMPEEELVITGVTDALKETGGLTRAEADLEEALAWLDELDDEAELELPDEEAPPTRITLPTDAGEPEPVADWPDFDDEPETRIVAPEQDELAQALDRLEMQVREEGVAVPETAVFALAFSDEELNAALDWIEDIEAAPDVAETAVVPEPDVDAWDDALDDDEEEDVAADAAAGDFDLQAMADDPEAWLEQLLSDDIAMDVEMEPPPIKPSEDAMFVTDDAALVVETAEFEEPIEQIEDTTDELIDSLLDDVGLDDMPDDPDAAVAWLDQMVDEEELEDAATLDGETDDMLLVTEEAESEAEAALDFDIGDDPEAWLEQMLSGDMALDIDMEPPPIKPSEDAMFVTDDAAAIVEDEPEPATEPELMVPETVDDLVEAFELDESEEDEEEATAEAESDQFGMADMMDDPEAWLEQLLSDDIAMDVEMEPPPIKPSEDAMFVTDDAQVQEPAAEAEPEIELDEVALEESLDVETDIISEVPDDPDEAVVWLEQLAARQGAALEELPTVHDPDAEPEMPDWMVEDLDDLTAESGLEPLAAVEETAVSFDLPAEPDDEDDIEMPDWLEEDEDDRVVGETAWLRTLPEVDTDTWLAAEEEATLAGQDEEIELPDTGPLRAPVATPIPDLLDDDLFEPVLEPSTGAYSVDEARLNVARNALDDGRLAEAISQFKEMVAEGSGMMTIIAELEQAADAHPRTPALSQVLGDAYMRNGQLQKALASYRAALDQM
ncbi:MAG: tetratricopeptide repeat protein [Ardenticatenaceae bacterium]|nr:tetratricopeptide repeat protein [Ardenticatenaceae bacterium]